MAQALKKADQEDPGFGKPGLRKKLHAWWHGYELPPPIDFDADLDAGGCDREANTATADGAWTPARVMLAQQVWGTGFLHPASEDYLYSLIEGWPLTASDKVLEVSDSLGAGGRIINGRFGVSVDLCLSDPVLAEFALGAIDASGAAESITICNGITGVFCPDPGSYNGILVRDALHRLEDVEDFLKPVVESLEGPEGVISISDFFAGPETESEEMARWMALQDVPATPWTGEEMTSFLQGNGLTLKSVDDDGGQYRAMIRAGWAAYLAGLDADAMSQMQRAVLEREAELWTCCAQALESGALRHIRIEAATG